MSTEIKELGKSESPSQCSRPDSKVEETLFDMRQMIFFLKGLSLGVAFWKQRKLQNPFKYRPKDYNENEHRVEIKETIDQAQGVMKLSRSEVYEIYQELLRLCIISGHLWSDYFYGGQDEREQGSLRKLRKDKRKRIRERVAEIIECIKSNSYGDGRWKGLMLLADDTEVTVLQVFHPDSAIDPISLLPEQTENWYSDEEIKLFVRKARVAIELEEGLCGAAAISHLPALADHDSSEVIPLLQLGWEEGEPMVKQQVIREVPALVKKIHIKQRRYLQSY